MKELQKYLLEKDMLSVKERISPKD